MANSSNTNMPSESAVLCEKFRDSCRIAVPEHPFSDAELIHVYKLCESVFQARKDVLIATNCPAPWDKQILRCEKAYDQAVQNCEAEPVMARFDSYFKSPLVARSRAAAEESFEKNMAEGEVPGMAIEQLDRNLSRHHRNKGHWAELEVALEAEIQAKRAADEQA